MRFQFNEIRQRCTKVKASTLLETVVASVIFMIVFIIAMDTLTRILISNHKDNDFLVIESAFNSCMHELENKELVAGENTYTFDWGEIHINISSYKEAVYQIHIQAITREKREVNYRYLSTNRIIEK